MEETGAEAVVDHRSREWMPRQLRWTKNFVVMVLIFSSAMGAFTACGFAEDTELGKTEYESHCAACHGENGKGEGPASAGLRTKPSDLTAIAKKNGGVFPTEVLYRIIDGRRTIRAHGTYEMPVWGSVFSGSEPEDAVRNRILAIIEYLKSVQVK